MNKTAKEAKELIDELKPLVKNAACDVVVCVPFTDLKTAADCCKGSNIHVGAQNVSWAESGAFTGEISADMLVEAGAEYVVIGHSERRQYFGETDDSVNKRLCKALEKGLKPILCVGESLTERQGGVTESVLKTQIEGAFKGLDKAAALKTVIAYEPVWAIGTGVTATSETAQETIAYIRSLIKSAYDAATAEGVRIQYGGSMNPKNVKELMAQPDIDGGLIGGASLKAADFSAVVNYDK